VQSRIRLWLGSLALAAAATIFALLVAKVALRATGHRMVFPQMYVEDADTVFRLKPGVKVRTIHAGYFDYEYTVNRLGFRGANAIAPKSSARQRLLFVGDSFTFGVGVDDSATYPARVDGRLRQWCGTPIETINGGVGGFGTSHELSFLQHYGWQLDPRHRRARIPAALGRRSRAWFLEIGGLAVSVRGALRNNYARLRSCLSHSA
jgi:hypothetical protein